MKLSLRSSRPLASAARAEPLERRAYLSAWFVAPSGADSNPGSIERPLATFTAALTLAQPGDVVYARAGTYSPSTTIDLTGAGTAAAPILFGSYNNERAVIDGSAIPFGQPTLRISGQYLVVQNFEVMNSQGAAMDVPSGQSITIINNSIHDSRAQAIVVGDGSSLTSAQDVTIKTNEIFHNDTDFAQSLPLQRDAAVLLDGVSGSHVTNNHIHENDGPGLKLLLVNNSGVDTNLISDNAVAELVLDNTSNTILERNFINNTQLTAYYVNGPADSIRLDESNLPNANPMSGVTLRNNIVANGASNFRYYNPSPDFLWGHGLTNFIITNNDFYGAVGPGANFWVDTSIFHNNNLVINNMFDEPSGAQAVFAPSGRRALTLTGFDFQHNNWFNGNGVNVVHGGAGVAAGPGDIDFDPLIAKGGTFDPAGYELLSQSPNIDKGVLVPGVGNDYYDVARPQGRARHRRTRILDRHPPLAPSDAHAHADAHGDHAACPGLPDPPRGDRRLVVGDRPDLGGQRSERRRLRDSAAGVQPVGHD